MEARLSDVVVFGSDTARGRGPLVEAFQQVLMEERRPVVIARSRRRSPIRWPWLGTGDGGDSLRPGRGALARKSLQGGDPGRVHTPPRAISTLAA